MTLNTRIDLKVPFVEKDQAKVHGARWDRENQTGTHRLALTSKPQTVAAQGRRSRILRARSNHRRRLPKRVSPSRNFLIE